MPDPVVYVVIEKNKDWEQTEIKACLVDNQGVPIQLGPQVGYGAFSTVFPVASGTASSVAKQVLKIVTIGYKISESDFTREAEAAKVAGRIGVGPKVAEAWICSSNERTVGFIMMEQLVDAVPLSSIIRSQDQFSVQDGSALLRLVLQQLDKLYTHKWIHGDLHGGNIFISNDRKKVWLLDFGKSHRVNTQYQMGIDELEPEFKWALEQKLITQDLITSFMTGEVRQVFQFFNLHSWTNKENFETLTQPAKTAAGFRSQQQQPMDDVDFWCCFV